MEFVCHVSCLNFILLLSGAVSNMHQKRQNQWQGAQLGDLQDSSCDLTRASCHLWLSLYIFPSRVINRFLDNNPSTHLQFADWVRCFHPQLQGWFLISLSNQQSPQQSHSNWIGNKHETQVVQRRLESIWAGLLGENLLCSLGELLRGLFFLPEGGSA